MTQQFITTDVLRLEVEDDPTGLVNLVENPSGELGGWGWVTPVATSFLAGGATAGGLTYHSPSPAAPSWFYTENLPVAAGQYVAASWNIVAVSGYYRVKIEWLTSALAANGTTTQSGYLNATGTTQHGPFLAPAGTAYARLRFDHYMTNAGANPIAGSLLQFKQVTVAKAATSGALGGVRTNLVPNPSFETNTTGWAGLSGTPIARTTAQAAVGTASLSVTGTSLIGAETPGGTSGMPVSGSTDYVLQAKFRAASIVGSCDFILRFYDATGAFISAMGTSAVTDTTSGWTTHSHAFTTPPTAAYVMVAPRVSATGGSQTHYIDAVMLEKSTTLGTYFDGSTTDAGGWDYAWTGTAHASASTATSAALQYIEPVPYLDVLGPTHDIKVVREALNIGTLEATILDATLDPANGDLIRPGRRVRLTALDTVLDVWTPLFTGQMAEASVTYELKDPNVPAQKRARIQMAAVDDMAGLANQKRSEGVATIAELPYVLEGAGTPWNVNGSGGQVATATVVATNDNASAVDQIAITRDTNLGYAWMDRWGTMQVWGPATIARDGTPLLDDSLVTDYDISYNTQDCINEVTIKFLRLNPDTGETEEIPYGPYRNETSIAEWGVRSAEFTVQGLSEETSAIPDLAATILAANSDPVVRVNSATAAVTEESMLDQDYLLCDLMAYASITKATAPAFTESSFIQRIEHSITPEKWIVTFGFLHEDVVASPQFTPSPTTGAGGKTIGQLLRPVGEVTMWYGTKPNIPAGWLPLDGSTVATMATDYPDLYALLGSTTLPDFTDKFPIGAGTKALGSIGGAATKTIAEVNLPAHSHPYTRRAAASALGSANAAAAPSSTGTLETGNTSNTGGGTPLDILNPYRALWFIIRAR